MKAVFNQQTTVEQWDVDYYHPIAIKYYDWAVADMLRMMDVPPGATVLDAGCGPGVHSIRVAKAGYRVQGIDISETMLNHAKHRIADSNLSDRVDLRQMDLTQLSYADHSFRYVFSWGVIIHIPAVEKALDELARIVEPGGKLALYLTNRDAFDHKIENMARFMLSKPLSPVVRSQLGDGYCYRMNHEDLWLWRFDRDSIVNYLAERGLRLYYRGIGELSEIQRRLDGFPRRLLLRLNNFAYRWRFPANIATTNLFVFEKK